MSLLRLITIACVALALVCVVVPTTLGIGWHGWLIAALLAWLLDGSVASPAVGKGTS